MNDAQVITIQGEQITEDEIAAFHKLPYGECMIILTNYAVSHGNHSAQTYRVKPGEPGHTEALALYSSMFTVTVDEEESDGVYFRARHYSTLEDLYNYLEQNNYAFTCALGATRDNYIRVYRRQQRLRPVVHRAWMNRLIKRYKTPELGQEDEE